MLVVFSTQVYAEELVWEIDEVVISKIYRYSGFRDYAGPLDNDYWNAQMETAELRTEVGAYFRNIKTGERTYATVTYRGSTSYEYSAEHEWREGHLHAQKYRAWVWTYVHACDPWLPGWFCMSLPGTVKVNVTASYKDARDNEKVSDLDSCDVKFVWVHIVQEA